MDAALLLTNIRSLVPVTDAEWQYISSFGIERKFKKGQLINREGDVNRFTNFIETGSAHVFYIDNDRHEHVVQPGICGWWVSDFGSFSNQNLVCSM